MISKRTLTVINASIALLIFILILSFLGVKLPSIGDALYILDDDDNLCVTNLNDNYNLVPQLDRCCLEARKQLECFKNSELVPNIGQLDWSCQSTDNIRVLLNNKAYYYCSRQPYW